MKFSLVVIGIGAPCVEQCFDALALSEQADEILYVLDDKGAAVADPSRLIPGGGEAFVKERWPHVRLLHNTGVPQWAPCNGPANVGMAAARNEYAITIHEDVLLLGNWYTRAAAALDALAACGFQAKGRRIAGLVWPGYERNTSQLHPAFPVPAGLVQYFSPVCTIFSRAIWEEYGRYDEIAGVWWDAQFETLMRQRGDWLLYVHWPAAVHLVNQSFVANNWLESWQANPLWGNFDDNYFRMFGMPMVHTGEIIPLPELNRLAV